MYEPDWGLPFREPYRGWLLEGLAYTGFLTAVTSVVSFGIGVALAVARVSQIRLARAAATIFVEIFRNIPAMFWVLFFFFVVPTLPSEDISFAINQWNYLGLAAAIAGLSLSHAAHICEVVRAGLQGIPEAQRRAAISLGLRARQVYVTVLLPQAIRISYPALGPRMVHNFHNTALAMVATVPELTWQSQKIETITFRGFEAITIATVLFIAGSLLITALFNWLERRSRVPQQSHGQA